MYWGFALGMGARHGGGGGGAAGWRALGGGGAAGDEKSGARRGHRLWGCALLGRGYFLRYLSNQSMKLRCQRRLFCGRRTQWVSSGK